jgi:hypothetical protein
MPNYIRQIPYRSYYYVKADNKEQAGEIALEWAMDGTDHDDVDEHGLIDRKRTRNAPLRYCGTEGRGATP